MKKRFLGVLLVLLFALVLVGCAPKDASAAKKKMEKKDYTVVVLDGEIAKSALSAIAEGAVANVTASKKTDDGTIAMTAVLFDSAKNAKAFYNASKDDEKKTSLVLSGKWVMYGDEKAVKDFK